MASGIIQTSPGAIIVLLWKMVLTTMKMTRGQYIRTFSAVMMHIPPTVTEANQILVSRGLNIKIEGSQNYAISDTEYARATYQSIAAGTSVDRGTVVTVRFLYDDRD